jgi:Bardet-Biedl syndrome 4 protein
MASPAARDKKNWLIHALYVRGETAECLRLIEDQLRAFSALCEYPLYVKGLIRRQQGQIQESLQLFQAATALNPRSPANLKAVARSLVLLGRHRAAIDVYAEAEAVSSDGDDWEVFYNKGLCHVHLKNYRDAEDCFLRANDAVRHDSTSLALANLYALQGDYRRAMEVCLEALDYTPENPELLTRVGLLHLRLGDSFKAFEYLGNALTHDPRSVKAILAAGSVMQDHNDADVALIKYRVAAVQTPNSPQLWNNIGMAFFSKQKYVAAVSCLKRALYLDPFEWIIAFNLGLVHLHTEQWASAFHYLTAAINMKPNLAQAYACLGIALSHLEDVENACAAYEKVSRKVVWFFWLSESRQQGRGSSRWKSKKECGS